MHYPATLYSIWSSPLVKHQSLSHTYNDMAIRIVYCTILSRCLPVPSFCCPVCAQTGCIFAVSEAEEVPLICTEFRCFWSTLTYLNLEYMFHITYICLYINEWCLVRNKPIYVSLDYYYFCINITRATHAIRNSEISYQKVYNINLFEGVV